MENELGSERGQPQASGEEASEGGPGSIHSDGTYERTGDLIAPPPSPGLSGPEPVASSHGAGCGLIFIGGTVLLLALFVVKCTGEF